MPLEDIIKNIKYKKCRLSHSSGYPAILFSYNYRGTSVEVFMSPTRDKSARYYIGGYEVGNKLTADLFDEILLTDCRRRLNWEEDFDIMDKDLQPKEY